jgi:hypothetical protein
MHTTTEDASLKFGVRHKVCFSLATFQAKRRVCEGVKHGIDNLAMKAFQTHKYFAARD